MFSGGARREGVPNKKSSIIRLRVLLSAEERNFHHLILDDDAEAKPLFRDSGLQE